LIFVAGVLITACQKNESNPSSAPVISARTMNPPGYPTNWVQPANFVSIIDNSYFGPIPVGDSLFYKDSIVDKNGTTGEDEYVTNTGEIKIIEAIHCQTYLDVVSINGIISEDTYDYYAQDKRGDVWYFGEDTKDFQGDSVSTEGSFIAGVDGALAGVIML